MCRKSFSELSALKLLSNSEWLRDKSTSGQVSAPFPRRGGAQGGVRTFSDGGISAAAGARAQYQFRATECDHAAHGVPYRPSMYPRPHRIWVAGLVRQSAPTLDIFDPGSAWGMP
jgi:hypothetical protein